MAGGVIGSVGSGVPENDLAIFLEAGECSFIAGEIAVVMSDGNFQDLAASSGGGERRIGLLDANVDVATNIAKAAVAHHRAGKQACFAENLEAIADPENHTAGIGEFFYGLHHGREAGDRAGAEIVAIGEAPRKDDGVAIREVLRLVPDELDGFVQDVCERVKRVVITIRSGKNYDSEFHCALAPSGIRESFILAHGGEFGLKTKDKP